MIEGIELLRAKRGDQSVTFSDVADHLVEFEGLYPEASDVVHRLAAFLARIEDGDHDHNE